MATAPAAKTDTKSTKQDFSDDIAADLAQIRQDIATLAKSLGTFGKTRIATLPDLPPESAEKTIDNARNALREIRREITSLEQDMEHRVASHPMQSLVVAAGLGFVIAHLIRR